MKRISLIAACGLLLAGCQEQGGGAPAGNSFGQGAVTVSAYTITPSEIEITHSGNGRVVPVEKVIVRPEVSGPVIDVLFKEGDWVTRGQALYRIDSEPYALALEGAEASVSAINAQIRAIEPKRERYRALHAKKAVSTQDLQAIEAEYDQLTSQLNEAEAFRDKAKVDLDNTLITSPVAGRTSLNKVSKGTIVSAYQQEPLTTITQLSPVYVDFSLSHESIANAEIQLGSTVRIKGRDGKHHQGELLNAEFVVNPVTDMRLFRAEFYNEDHQLLPGMYVRAEWVVTETDQGIAIPSTALFIDPRGRQSVYTISQEGKAVAKPVITAGQGANNTVIIRSGLSMGDRVVYEGVGKLREGAAVVTPDTPMGGAK
jgi:membrane fusion protein (multidrug efflux system)